MALGDNAKTVLSLLREQSMDGFTLQSKSGLDKPSLLGALRELHSQSLIRVAGDLTEPGMDEAFYSVPLGSVGDADFQLGRLNAMYKR